VGFERKPDKMISAVSVVLHEPKAPLAGGMRSRKPLFRLALLGWLLSIDRAMEGNRLDPENPTAASSTGSDPEKGSSE
jgi:hypothetical protein